MDPNVNLPPIDLDLRLGLANENPNPVPAPDLDPSNANLDLNLGLAYENPNTGSKGTKRQREEEEEEESVIKEWIDGHINEDVDLDHVNEELAETYELPLGLTLVLRRYQKEFVAWALKQEQSDVKGGILADEVGMGKTIQAISLVLAKRALYREQPDETMGTTLVICLGASVPLWKTEFKKFTDVKVLEYQGSDRNKTKDVFSNYDFVLTTYHTVSREYSHRENSTLHSVKWSRIILDEADDHGIRNRFSQTSEAVFALEATYRWALTSTPLLNNLENIGSMIWFLRIDPYGSYACDECDCKPAAHIAETKLCPTCRHTGRSHIYWWTRFVVKPIRECRDSNKMKRGKIFLKHKVLKGILIRRTKRNREAEPAAP